jgi:predicted nucleotide-binding protein
MTKRFRGRQGKRLLLETLRAQKIVGHDARVAAALARRIRLTSCARSGILIRQGAEDNSLYFLLSGSVAILVNGREVATRTATDHVGEMALVETGARRSATVVATEPTVAARISGADFSAVANVHPCLWRALSAELAHRLRERGRFLAPPNPRPVLFIGSSREALPVARGVVLGLKRHRVEVRLWSDGVFSASRLTLEDLEQQLRSADFALLVAPGDDRVRSRGRDASAPRDNVVFELGLFMGALSRHRTFLLTPRTSDLKLPSDLLGLNRLSYNPRDRSMLRATTQARQELAQIMETLGPR